MTGRSRRRWLRIAAGVVAWWGAAAGVASATSDGGGGGTVVVTHGFQGGGALPDWPFWMARAAIVRAGGGRLLVYSPASGELELCDSPAVHPACDGTPGEGLTGVVFDWGDDSNNTGSGWSEAAAEALFAALVKAAAAPEGWVDLSALHLIGHSRGTVVNSEAAERLLSGGFPAPVQVTTIDPHDWGGFAPERTDPETGEPEGGWDDFDVNELHPEYQCGDPPGAASGVCSWQGVAFHDNYWQTELFCPILEFLDGRPVPGTAGFDMTPLPSICHSSIHAWYYFTIDTAATSHPGDPGIVPNAAWWDAAGQCVAGQPRGAPLARTEDGYNFSAAGGGAGGRCDETGTKQTQAFDFLWQEGLVNGDFEKSGSGGSIPGWSVHGGGGTGAAATDAGGRFLRLAGGEWRQHNRTWVPAAATHLAFCERTNAAGGGGEVLAVSVVTAAGPQVVFSQPVTSPGDWSCFEAPLPSGSAGSVALVRADLLGGDGAVEVDLDLFRWATVVAGPTCDDLVSFRARCNAAEAVQARVVLSTPEHAGDTLVLELDGVPHDLTIVNRRASFNEPKAGVGAHALEITDPPGCFPVRVVTCQP